MMFRYNWSGPRGFIGCGALLALFGLLLLTPFVAALVWALGWFFVALGIVVVALGIVTWAFGPGGRRRGRRDDFDDYC